MPPPLTTQRIPNPNRKPKPKPKPSPNPHPHPYPNPNHTAYPALLGPSLALQDLNSSATAPFHQNQAQRTHLLGHLRGSGLLAAPQSRRSQRETPAAVRLGLSQTLPSVSHAEGGTW